jgi:dienelactone hydrolase
MSCNVKTRQLAIGRNRLEGLLTVPANAGGLVIFAHGSGSSRLSPRNTHAAEQLQAAGLGTLLFDLLTEAEAQDRANVFDIALLGQRVADAVRFVRADAKLSGLPIGLFGASTGAAAALVAAAELPADIAAVVSRGGRPDLAASVLERVEAPTLLIVGGNDPGVIELNREAYDALTCEKKFEIVPGARHLFEEPGTLDQVVEAAAEWFG